MRRVLVSGGSGFIGRHCLAPLNKLGFDVHAIHNTSSKDLNQHVTWHQVDLLDPTQAARIIDAVRPSHLLHLAWSFGAGGADAAPKGTSPFGYRWTVATLDLIRHFAEAGGQRLVTVGSSFEYDWGGDGICIENKTPRIPSTYYGTCKNALADLIGGYSDHMGFSSAWARLFFLYGPYEPPARLVPSVVCSLLRSKPALCSHGNQIRDYLYVQDAADALAFILDSEVTGPINVGSQQPTMLKTIINQIGERIGRSDLIRLGALQARPNEAPQVLADTTILSQRVGWSPRYDLDEGLDATIAWWRENIGSVN
mgnify:FL=1